VLAADAGGAREIVTDGVTGTLFSPGDVGELAAALTDIDWLGFDVGRLKANAARFSHEQFRRKLHGAVDSVLRREGVGGVEDSAADAFADENHKQARA